MAAYRELAMDACKYLAPEGELLLEIGQGQGKDVRRIFGDAGYCLSRVAKDLDKRERVLGFKKE